MANAGPPKKHPCPDCSMCQMCSDSRCALCRCDHQRRSKLSMAEQIAIYEKLNADDPAFRTGVKHSKDGDHGQAGRVTIINSSVGQAASLTSSPTSSTRFFAQQARF